MIKTLLFILPLLSLPLLGQEEQKAEITSHSQYSASLVALLEKTLASLQACQDAESVEKQLPILKTYQQEMDTLSRVLTKLPTPSAVDYVQAEEHLLSFNKTWRLISEEIERLGRQRLLTQDLLDVLKIQP